MKNKYSILCCTTFVFFTLLLVGLSGCNSDNMAVNNEISDNNLEVTSWTSSGCLKGTEDIGKIDIQDNGSLINITNSDTGSVITVPITTYCASNFISTYKTIRPGYLKITIQTKPQDIHPKCTCPYELSFTTDKSISEMCTIDVVMDIYDSIRTLTFDGHGDLITDSQN